MAASIILWPQANAKPPHQLSQSLCLLLFKGERHRMQNHSVALPQYIIGHLVVMRDRIVNHEFNDFPISTRYNKHGQ